MHLTIRIVTWIFLAASLVAAGIWVVRVRDFEPTLTLLSLSLAAIGFATDRWLDQRERRQQMLYMLAHELQINVNFMTELSRLAASPGEVHMKPVPLPPMLTDGLLAVISSGAFTSSGDRKLWNAMHAWRLQAVDLNVRVAVTRDATMVRPEIAFGTYKAMVESAVFRSGTTALNELVTMIRTEYASESGITAETQLFAAPAPK